MNQQGASSSIQSPRTPDTLAHSPKSDIDDGDELNIESQSSWWSLNGFWNSSSDVFETPSHLSSETNLHDSLMVPRVEEETISSSVPITYRLQPRRQVQSNRTTTTTDNDEEEDFFYNIPSKNKALSPLRNRSPKMPTGRPPMMPKSPMQSTKMMGFQNPYSPVRTIPEETTSKTHHGWNHFLFGTSKRRAAFWTVLSVLMIAPTIMLGGRDHNIVMTSGIDYSEKEVYLGPYEPEDASQFFQEAHRALYNLYETNTFMVQDQVLNAGEAKMLPFNSAGVNLKQDTNGNLVLYNSRRVLWESGLNKGPSSTTAYMTILQADGNLVTRSMTFDIRRMDWATNVDWNSGSRGTTITHGEYALLLTPSADGLMIVRRYDGKITWATAPVDLGTPTPPAPTRRPTAAPVQQPSPRPTPSPIAVQTPVALPQVVAAPSISPPDFPMTVSRSTDYTIQSGPMIGYTTHNSCKVWVFLGLSLNMELVYWKKGNGGSIKSTTLVPDANANNAAIKTITGLQADTTYQYEIRINNKWLAQGQFKTAPVSDRSTSFQYVLASCMDVKSDAHSNQPVWKAIQQKGVDFAMLPGDTVYLNYLDWTRQWEVLYGRVWFRYLQQRAEPNFANFIKNIPTYGTWDNHDYGTEYSDRNQRGKDNSLKAWRDLWPNPYQGSSKGPGNYYSFSWGDVDFFVLDCRWYRSWGLGILFGSAQLAWLEEQLVASKATFKVIVSASDVMEADMTSDLQKIGSIVSRNRISGVLFNSGDIHRNEYKSQMIANWPYKVHQFTSSGVGVEWRRNFAIAKVNTAAQDPEYRVEFHSADSTTTSTSYSNQPNLACSGLGSSTNNRHAQCTQRVRLSELTP